MTLRVGVTRAADQASELQDALEAAGFEPVALPMTQVMDLAPEPLREGLERLGRGGAIAFVSTHGVFSMQAAVAPRALSDALAGTLVAAVGGRTAATLSARGVRCALVPERQDAEGLLAAILAAREGRSRRWLLPRAEAGKRVLEDGLRQAGVEVDAVVAYRTVASRDGGALREAVRDGLAAVTFAAGSAVDAFVDLLGSGVLLEGIAVVTIGPSTSAACRTRGLTVAAEAFEPSVGGLVAAVHRALAAG